MNTSAQRLKAFRVGLRRVEQTITAAASAESHVHSKKKQPNFTMARVVPKSEQQQQQQPKAADTAPAIMPVVAPALHDEHREHEQHGLNGVQNDAILNRMDTLTDLVNQEFGSLYERLTLLTDRLEGIEALLRRTQNTAAAIFTIPAIEFEEVGPAIPATELGEVRPAIPATELGEVGPAIPAIEFEEVGPATQAIEFEEVGPAIPAIELEEVGPAIPAIELEEVGPAIPATELEEVGPAIPATELGDVGPAIPATELGDVGPAIPAIELGDVGPAIPATAVDLTIVQRLGLAGIPAEHLHDQIKLSVKKYGFENLVKSPVYFLKSLAQYAHIPYTSPKRKAVQDILEWAAVKEEPLIPSTNAI
jgi:hypothetical protein